MSTNRNTIGRVPKFFSESISDIVGSTYCSIDLVLIKSTQRVLLTEYCNIPHDAQKFNITLNTCTSEKRACKPRLRHSSLLTISAPVHEDGKLRKETESAKTRKKSQKPACGSKTRIPTSSSEWEGWEQRNGYGGKAWSKLSHTVQQNYRNHNCT